MKVSFLTGPRDECPQPVDVAGLEELGELLSAEATPEKGSTCWIAGEAHGRTDEHVQEVHFWVLDFDGSEPPWDTLAGWNYIAHTTHSHLKITDSHPEPVPCWRVIVELDKPASAREWKRQYKAAVQMQALKAATDAKTCNPARIWYVPRPDAEWRVNLEARGFCMPPLAAVEAQEAQEDRPELDGNADGLLSDGALFWPAVERMMRALPPSISGQGGDDRLFEAACVCRSSFRLNEDATMRALEIFNSRCKPPWDEDRLRYKADQATRDRQHPPGELVPPDARRALRQAAGFVDPPTPVLEAPGASGEAPFRYITAAEMAEPLGPVDWLVQDLGLAPGRPAILVGYAGSGKTMAAQEIALSVASGAPAFMGRMHARQGSVLHIDVDQGRRATTARYQALARGRGLDLGSLPIDLVVFDGHLTKGGQVDQDAVQRLANACEGRALCIIDSLRGIAPGMDENSSDIGSVLQVLAFLSDATEQQCGLATTFLVLHHEGKPSQGSSRQNKHAGRGSSAIQDRAGAVWRLVQDEETRTVDWVMSKISEHDTEYGKPFRTQLLKADDGGLTIRALDVETKVSAARANVEHIAARLAAKLRDADRWMSRGELTVDISGKSTDKTEALALLRERKQIAYRLDGSKHQYHWNPKMAD